MFPASDQLDYIVPDQQPDLLAFDPSGSALMWFAVEIDQPGVVAVQVVPGVSVASGLEWSFSSAQTEASDPVCFSSHSFETAASDQVDY